MISDREIWMSAKVMIARYGSNAGIDAARRADQPLETGDGYAIWKQIITAIERLQAAPEPGEKVR
jgi:hypothetical protein